MHPHALTPEQLSLLASLIDTRFDVVCEHLAEEAAAASPRLRAVPLMYRDEAQALLADVRAAARWAAVPAGLRDRVATTAELARRMWEVDGAPFEAVSKYVRVFTPREHVQLVLEEAYRDAPQPPSAPVMAEAA